MPLDASWRCTTSGIENLAVVPSIRGIDFHYTPLHKTWARRKEDQSGVIKYVFGE